jgi:hypothetical protein
MKTKLLTLCCVAGLIQSTSAVDIGKGWKTYFSKGDGEKENIMKVTQIPDAPWPIQKPGGCTFRFPQNGHINYITRRCEGGLKTKFIQVTMKVYGKATFIPLDGAAPATAHVYIEVGSPLINAWWARSAWFDLPKMIASGKAVTLKIPLTMANWQNISGQGADYSADTKANFTYAITHLGHAGVSFGGTGAGWGHGVKIKDGGDAVCTIVGMTFPSQ